MAMEEEKLTLKALESHMNDELEKLRSEYEKKLAEITEKSGEKNAASDREAEKLREEQEKWLDEYVEIKLFRDNERYKDDVFVSVNGQNCLIKRGEWVKVKRKFALVIDQSELQDACTAGYMHELSDRFNADSKARNI